MSKTKPSDGDEIIFKFSQGTWKVHVKYSAGGISGRVIPYNTFEEALAAVKEDVAV